MLTQAERRTVTGTILNALIEGNDFDALVMDALEHNGHDTSDDNREAIDDYLSLFADPVDYGTPSPITVAGRDGIRPVADTPTLTLTVDECEGYLDRYRSTMPDVEDSAASMVSVMDDDEREALAGAYDLADGFRPLVWYDDEHTVDEETYYLAVSGEAITFDYVNPDGSVTSAKLDIGSEAKPADLNTAVALLYSITDTDVYATLHYLRTGKRTPMPRSLASLYFQ